MLLEKRAQLRLVAQSAIHRNPLQRHRPILQQSRTHAVSASAQSPCEWCAPDASEKPVPTFAAPVAYAPPIVSRSRRAKDSPEYDVAPRRHAGSQPPRCPSIHASPSLWAEPPPASPKHGAHALGSAAIAPPQIPRHGCPDQRWKAPVYTFCNEVRHCLPPESQFLRGYAGPIPGIPATDPAPPCH